MVKKLGKYYPMSRYAHTIIPVRGVDRAKKGIAEAVLRVCGVPPDKAQIGLGNIISEKLPFPQKKRDKNQLGVRSVHLVLVDENDSIVIRVMEAASFLKLDNDKTNVILDDRCVKNNDHVVGIARTLSDLLAGAHICVRHS